MSELDRIRSALAHVSPYDRATWLKIGMAIKSELDDSGFSMWDEWSEQADSYDIKNTRDVWKSIEPNGKVGIGTLFHEAKANGWRRDEPLPKRTPIEIEAQRLAAAKQTELNEADERDRQEAAMKHAAAILDAATGDPSTHPYIIRKKSPPMGARIKRGPWPQRGWRDALLVPIYQADARVWSIEAISADGKKDSLKNGKKSAGFYPIGKPKVLSRY